MTISSKLKIPRIQDLPLRQKFHLVLVVPFAVQILLLILLVRGQYENRSAGQKAIRTVEVLLELEESFRSILASSNYTHAFVLTSEETFVGRFEDEFRRARESLIHLKDLVSDNKEQVELLAAVELDYIEIKNHLDKIIELTRQNKIADVLNLIRGFEPTQALDRLRHKMEGFRSAEQQINLKRREVLDYTSSKNVWLAGLGVVATICVSMLAGWLFQKDITARFLTLSKNVDNLVEGRPLSQELYGSDEISALDRAFHVMARELEERRRENEMFIYSVSHDLRAPLVNLQGFSKELTYALDDIVKIIDQPELSDRDKGALHRICTKECPSSLGFIQGAVQSLSRIIDALLRLSRAGRVQYDLQMVELDEIFQRVSTSLHNSLTEKRVELIVDKLPAVFGDPTALEQVMTNLVGNSIKYANPAQPLRIEVGMQSVGESMTTIFVRDNGLGISRDYQAKVFLVFQRFHEEVAPGEGVGLAIVKRIVERHGGTITFESEAGAGTAFYVSLPTVRVEQAIFPVTETVYASRQIEGNGHV